jgi:predicted permease
MSGLQQFLSRSLGFFRKGRLEAEMEEEMRLHVEHLTSKHVAEGLSPEEARYAAQRRFGGVDQIKEQCRDGMGWRLIEDLTRDFRFGARSLRKKIGFTAVAALTLALCIGANTAIFSVVSALLLKPLPFRESDRIVEIFNFFNSKKGQSNLVQYVDYKANTTSYESIGLWGLTDVTVGSAGSMERVTAAQCTAEMFDVLGVKPVLGQFFTLKSSRWGEDKVVVLTEPFWEAHFNGDPGVLDKKLIIDGEACRIVGVMPRAIQALDARVRLIKPIAWKPEWISPNDRYYLTTSLYGRLKQGVSVSEALAEATAVERRYYETMSPSFKQLLDRASYRIGVGLMREERVQATRSILYLLQGAVVLVLVIGCINIAHLLLSRANGRQGELAIRLALGAGRGAIARQLVVESLILTLTGAALGMGLAWGAIGVINRFSARMLPEMQPFAADGAVLTFALLLSVMVGLLIGLLPVAHILGADLTTLIHRTSRSASGSRSVRGLSSILVTSQVASALILLTGAGLLIHSFANAIAVKPGFDPQNMVVGRIALPGSYENGNQGAVFQKRLMEALKEIPGVSDVALASSVPFEGHADGRGLTLKDRPIPHDSAQPHATEVGVSVGYFQALHIQLLEGRFFEERDAGQEGREYIVDERFAQRYFPGRSAVGEHFTFQNRHLPAKTADWPVIIGVVRNVPHNGVEEKRTEPVSYWPLRSTWLPWVSTEAGGLNIFVRSPRPLSDLISSVREKLHGIDPSVPLFHTERLQSAIDESFDGRRTVMLLLVGFALLALLLSSIGIYGVLAYDVSLRTREIGIRSAIGASRTQIIGMVMRQGLWRTAVGLGLGLAGAVLLSRFMASMLFGLTATDPWAYVSVSLLLAAVASLASYLPARRAAMIDPIQALRIA